MLYEYYRCIENDLYRVNVKTKRICVYLALNFHGPNGKYKPQEPSWHITGLTESKFENIKDRRVSEEEAIIEFIK